MKVAAPPHLFAFLALVVGIAAGGLSPELLAPVAYAVRVLLDLLILLVPVLIIGALSPAIATLVRRGLAGRFAGAVLLWFCFSTAAAAFIGMLVGAAVFPSGIDGGPESVGQASRMLSELGSGGASLPVLAIVGSVLLGLVGAKEDKVYALLSRVEAGIARLGSSFGYAMVPLILALGIMIGVRFGVQ